MLRSVRWVVVVGMVVGALVGLFLDLHLDRLPVSSTAQLVVSDGTGAPASSDAAATEASYLANKMPTYAQFATSDDVLGPAAAAVGTSVDALRPEVAVDAVPNTTMLTIEVRAASPRAATSEAGAVTQSLTAAITRLETPPGQGSMVDVTTSSPPSVPTARTVPPWGALTAAGAAAGALLVVLAALVWASRWPQRGWRWFTEWLFRVPEIDPSLR